MQINEAQAAIEG